MSELLLELRAEYEERLAAWWAGDRVARLQTGRAYDKWFRQACAEGRPPDALDRWIVDERERFMSRIVPGADGHAYWHVRTEHFKQNNGKTVMPRRWWWVHVKGPLPRGTIKPTCGERRCLNPRHCEFISWGDQRRRYSQEQMLGALKVAALRIGRAPSIDEYHAMKLGPSSSIIRVTFGNWGLALRAAGLESATATIISERMTKWQKPEILQALRDSNEENGFTPYMAWWERNKMLPSRSTIERRFGSFYAALVEAGLAA